MCTTCPEILLTGGRLLRAWHFASKQNPTDKLDTVGVFDNGQASNQSHTPYLIQLFYDPICKSFSPQLFPGRRIWP